MIVIEQYNTGTGKWDILSNFNPVDEIKEIDYQGGSSLRVRYIKIACKTCKYFNWKLSGEKNWGECQNLRNIEATRISLITKARGMMSSGGIIRTSKENNPIK